MATLVLLHGGAASARQWDWVVERLASPVRALDVPGRGAKPADVSTLRLPAVVDDLLSDLADVEGPIVLVAHSSGGLLVPGLVAGLGDRLRRLVLIAASVTPDGGTGFACMKPRHADNLRLLLAAAERGEVRAVTPAEPPPVERVRTSWGTSLTDEQVAFVTDPSRWISDTVNFYDEVLDWTQARALPVTYVTTLRDTAVPLELQHEMAARVTGTLVPLDTGHLPFVTMPDVVAALLDGQAASA